MTGSISNLLLAALYCFGASASYVAEAFAAPPISRRTFTPSSRRWAVLTSEATEKSIFPSADTAKSDYDTLLRTIETRKVHPDIVFASMLRLEKLSYHERWTQNQETAERMTRDLEGNWRPVFSSGTTVTQERLGGRRLNYFPIKAVISLRPLEGKIQNGLYIGNFYLARLNGTCQYQADMRKFQFRFHDISFLNGAFKIDFKEGQDIEFALLMGLGGKIGRWNILLADARMMMARGAGQAITLWKRQHGHKAEWW